MRALVVAALAALGAGVCAPQALAQASTAPVLRPLQTEAQWMRACQRRVGGADLDDVCGLDWGTVEGASEVADAVLSVVPERAGITLTAPGVRARLPQVRWAARPVSGAALSGAMPKQYGQEDVRVSAGFDRIMFSHLMDENEPDFFHLPGALELRGATVQRLACDNRPGSMHGTAWAVTAPGRLPFLVVEIETFGAGGAAKANLVDLSGQAPTLARARAFQTTSRWSACPTQ